jgi:hypothetical protein
MKDSLLRSLVREEIKKLIQDEVIFPSHSSSGLQGSHDETGMTCPSCGQDHGESPCGTNTRGRNLGYGHIKSDDREGRMTRGHLYKISKYSQSLHDQLRDDDDLPEWVQSKIARAADKLESVYGYLEYKLSRQK